MALKVYWSKKAIQKFDEIIDYLEEYWGERSKKLFIKKTFDFLDILEVYPEIGSLERPTLQVRAFVLVKQITLFYQVKKTKIVLLNFYDTRQNPEKRKF